MQELDESVSSEPDNMQIMELHEFCFDKLAETVSFSGTDILLLIPFFFWNARGTKNCVKSGQMKEWHFVD